MLKKCSVRGNGGRLRLGEPSRLPGFHSRNMLRSSLLPLFGEAFEQQPHFIKVIGDAQLKVHLSSYS